jgi:hypothetical protein
MNDGYGRWVMHNFCHKILNEETTWDKKVYKWEENL